MPLDVIICESKHKFISSADARKTIKKGVSGIRPYKCPNCKSWHVGHAVGKKRKK